MAVAVYSALFGEYDTPRASITQNIECDFFRFTDNANTPSGGWQTVYVPRSDAITPLMQAKWFKILSHKLFPNGRLFWPDHNMNSQISDKKYDVVIWTDSSFEITSKYFASDIRNCIGNKDAYFFPHCMRRCIREEAEFLLSLPKFQHLKIKNQVEFYNSQGMISPTGLFECGIIARKAPHTVAAVQMEELWWDEINNRTFRDQLSLPYVINKTNPSVKVSEYTVYNNPWTKHHLHLTTV